VTVIQLFKNSNDAQPFTAGECIFREGENGNTMYVLTEGEVELATHGQVVDVVGEGGIFGEMALIDHGSRSATAIARADCKVMAIDEKRFAYMVQQTPNFALQVMRIMAERLRRMDARL